jgi:hypothetical protein
LKDQEPILTRYFDSLIQKLHEKSTKGPVDLSLYFNLVTADITGDLTFGQSFDCLETAALHVSRSVRSGQVARLHHLGLGAEYVRFREGVCLDWRRDGVSAG